ncbi:MAG: FAD-dependent oxidoreductase [Spirulinaceae cyanobacterium]
MQWQRSPVRVITQKTEFSADHVVVTLPLGVLQAKSVRFSPELPHSKQDAIAKLGMADFSLHRQEGIFRYNKNRNLDTKISRLRFFWRNGSLGATLWSN